MDINLTFIVQGFAFFAVVRRWAGAPRSQFFMRLANWNMGMCSKPDQSVRL